jgi:hypothetical protein
MMSYSGSVKSSKSLLFHEQLFCEATPFIAIGAEIKPIAIFRECFHTSDSSQLISRVAKANYEFIWRNFPGKVSTGFLTGSKFLFIWQISNAECIFEIGTYSPEYAPHTFA